MLWFASEALTDDATDRGHGETAVFHVQTVNTQRMTIVALISL